MTESLRSRALIILATLLWGGLVAYLFASVRASHLATDTTELIAHHGTLMVLAALIYLLLRPTAGRLPAQIRAAGIAIAITVGFAVVLEAAQLYLPERGAEVIDVLFGVYGAITGAVSAFLWDRFGLTSALGLAVSISTVAVVAAIAIVGENTLGAILGLTM